MAAAEADEEVAPASEASAELHGCPLTELHGQVLAYPTRERYVEVVKLLADDGYTMCVDVTAVDYVAHPGRALPDGIERGRFEVVTNLLDLGGQRRVRLRVQVPDDDATLPSLFDVHPGTEAMEREVYDMFGIAFTDHPDLTRILMPEDWEGHPLRKDYDQGMIPVQFKGTQ